MTEEEEEEARIRISPGNHGARRAIGGWTRHLSRRLFCRMIVAAAASVCSLQTGNGHACAVHTIRTHMLSFRQSHLHKQMPSSNTELIWGKIHCPGFVAGSLFFGYIELVF